MIGRVGALHCGNTTRRVLQDIRAAVQNTSFGSRGAPRLRSPPLLPGNPAAAGDRLASSAISRDVSASRPMAAASLPSLEAQAFASGQLTRMVAGRKDDAFLQQVRTQELELLFSPPRARTAPSFRTRRLLVQQACWAHMTSAPLHAGW